MIIDILIDGAMVLTMTGPGVGVLPNASIAISGNRIVTVGPAAELAQLRARAHRVIDGCGRLVMPGLIDGHIHAGLSLLRGVAQDMKHWMQLGLAPFTAQMTPDDDIAGAALTAVEAIHAGTTLLADFGDFVPRICEQYVELGVRARVAGVINELPPDLSAIPVGELYPFDPAAGQRSLRENIALISEFEGAGNGRITCMLGPQGTDMLSAELLREIGEHSRRHDIMIHMHVAQGDREIDQMMARYGRRSIEFLDELGLLNDRLLAAHLTEATAAETELAARRGAALACCPGSIAIIDGIVTPVVEFLEAGGRVALGSDQAPGNNCANMWNEMKLVCLLNKIKFRDPTVMPAHTALRLATVEAAGALGLGDQLGTIEPGRLADLIIVDLEQPGLVPRLDAPVRNVVPNLVYSARGHEVETVIIDGRVILDERRLTTADEAGIIHAAQQAASRLSGRVHNPPDRGQGPVSMTRQGLI